MADQTYQFGLLKSLAQRHMKPQYNTRSNPNEIPLGTRKVGFGFGCGDVKQGEDTNQSAETSISSSQTLDATMEGNNQRTSFSSAAVSQPLVSPKPGYNPYTSFSADTQPQDLQQQEYYKHPVTIELDANSQDLKQQEYYKQPTIALNAANSHGQRQQEHYKQPATTDLKAKSQELKQQEYYKQPTSVFDPNPIKQLEYYKLPTNALGLNANSEEPKQLDYDKQPTIALNADNSQGQKQQEYYKQPAATFNANSQELQEQEYYKQPTSVFDPNPIKQLEYYKLPNNALELNANSEEPKQLDYDKQPTISTSNTVNSQVQKQQLKHEEPIIALNANSQELEALERQDHHNHNQHSNTNISNFQGLKQLEYYQQATKALIAANGNFQELKQLGYYRKPTIALNAANSQEQEFYNPHSNASNTSNSQIKQLEYYNYKQPTVALNAANSQEVQQQKFYNPHCYSVNASNAANFQELQYSKPPTPTIDTRFNFNELKQLDYYKQPPIDLNIIKQLEFNKPKPPPPPNPLYSNFQELKQQEYYKQHSNALNSNNSQELSIKQKLYRQSTCSSSSAHSQGIVVMKEPEYYCQTTNAANTGKYQAELQQHKYYRPFTSSTSAVHSQGVKHQEYFSQPTYVARAPAPSQWLESQDEEYYIPPENVAHFRQSEPQDDYNQMKYDPHHPQDDFKQEEEEYYDQYEQYDYGTNIRIQPQQIGQHANAVYNDESTYGPKSYEVNPDSRASLTSQFSNPYRPLPAFKSDGDHFYSPSTELDPHYPELYNPAPLVASVYPEVRRKGFAIPLPKQLSGSTQWATPGDNSQALRSEHSYLSKNAAFVNSTNDQALPEQLVELFQSTHCQLCSVSLGSDSESLAHYNGQKHKKMIDEWLSFTSPPQYPPDPDSSFRQVRPPTSHMGGGYNTDIRQRRQPSGKILRQNPGFELVKKRAVYYNVDMARAKGLLASKTSWVWPNGQK